jgi:ATP-dependent helicase HrpA
MDGYGLLRDLGAVDDFRGITTLGRRMARLPVDPRVARILWAGAEHDCVTEMLVLAAFLSIQDPRERPTELEAEADARHAEFGDPKSDFLGHLSLWRAYEHERRHASTRRQRAWCRERFLSFARMREWHDLHQELRGLVHDMGLREALAPARPDAVHRALLTGFIDRIGLRELRREDRARYTGARGLRFRIFPGSSVKSTPRWIVAASLIETSSPFAMTVGTVRRAWLEEAGAALLKRSYHEPHWRIETGRVEAFEQSTLYGLLIYAKRRVDYGAVDPSGAHALFLSEALVAGRLGVRPPFLAHNLDLEREILAMEARLRRRDLLATPTRRAAFYAARVPVTISDRRGFERWRHEAEKREARLFYMTRDDLLATDAPSFALRDYPDELELAGNRLELRYRFEPGDEHDGVTLAVPAALLAELRESTLEHLVPAWLAERIEALLRSLPKSLRRALPSLQPLARELGSVLREDRRALDEAIAASIHKQTGVTVPPDAFRTSGVPRHLRPLLRVLDDRGRVLAEDRDLSVLQARFAERGLRSLREPEWEREGLTRFDFEALPDEVLVREGGVQLRAHPALEDRGSSVALRLMRSPQAATRATRTGLARLFMLAMPQQATLIRDRIARDANVALLAQGLATPTQLGDQLAQKVFEQVFVADDAPPVRTRAAFDARLQGGRAEVVDASAALVAAVRKTLELRRKLMTRLAATPAAWSRATSEIRSQLDALIQPDFVRATPPDQLRELPRYVEAMSVRLDKLRDGQGRDTALAAQVQPYWERYRTLPADAREHAPATSAVVRFRWMIEELRVSLFAQALGTRERISPQRLEKQWEQVRAELRGRH